MTVVSRMWVCRRGDWWDNMATSRSDVPILDLRSLPPIKVLSCEQPAEPVTGRSESSSMSCVMGKHVSMGREGWSSLSSSPKGNVLPSSFRSLTIASPGTSIEGSTPRSAVTPMGTPLGTPRSPVPPSAMQSPLKMVGLASPCSVRVRQSSRLEGSTVIKPIKKEEMMHTPSMIPHAKEDGVIPNARHGQQMNVSNAPLTMLRHWNGLQPRELSFGNLLENNDTDSELIGMHDISKGRPIGLKVHQSRKISVDAQRRSVVTDKTWKQCSPRKRSRKSEMPMRAAVSPV